MLLEFIINQFDFFITDAENINTAFNKLYVKLNAALYLLFSG
jgi:hypothetical protein